MRVRSRKLDEEKKRNLIEAAIEEIAANGIEGASYNRIIERSGLSKGAVYYYYENKESLYSVVLEEVERRFLMAVGKLKLPDDADVFWDVCGAYYERALGFAVSNMQLIEVARILVEPLRMDGVEAFEPLRRADRWTRTAIRKGQEIGALRSDLPAEFLSGILHAVGVAMDSWFFDMYRSDPKTVDTKDFVRFAINMYRRILSP